MTEVDDKIQNENKKKNICKLNKIFGYKNKIIILFSIFIIILFFILIIVFLINKIIDLNNELEREKTLSVEKIEFKNVGKLVAQEARVTVIKNHQNDREFLKIFDIPFTKYVYIFSYDIDVSAYVDFEKISYETNDKKKIFIVNLPHSKLNDNSAINKESKKILYDNKNMFNSVKPDQIEKFQMEMIKEAETKAVDSGILKKADKYAKILIENMIKGNNSYSDYNVEFNYID